MHRIAPLLLATSIVLAGCSSEPEPAAQPETAETGEPQTVSLDAMPASFLGRWDFAEEDCATDASEMRLDIGADEVAFYESSAAITAIEQTAPGSLKVGHSFSGEGEQWEETLAYELNTDGDRLTVTTPEGSMSTRMRCP